MGDSYNEQYNDPNQTVSISQVETTGINIQVAEDFPEIQNIIPEYNGDNKEVLNNFLQNNPDLKQSLINFFKNEKTKLKDRILCKKNLMKCKTDEELKSIIAELAAGGFRIGKEEKIQDIITQTKDEKRIKEKIGSIEIEEQKDIMSIAENEGVEYISSLENKLIVVDKKDKAITDIDNGEKDKERQNAILKEVKSRRAELIEKYKDKDLDSKTNEYSENYNKVKSDLENNGVLNQLRQDNYDEQFINDYIKIQATLRELKNNPTVYEQDDISAFDKLVKNLNNSCNIPDTKLSNFDIKNISQTRKELFNEDIGNDSLIQAKASNLESRKYPEGFFDMKDEEIIINYGRFLDGTIKDFWLKYQNDMDFRNKTDAARNNPNPSDEETQLQLMYDNMLIEVKNKKEEMDNRTKNLMEELCIISQIKGMYMCMGEGENFNLNKANEIHSDNGVLTLNGHIDGVNFAIRQDTKNPEARLQTSLRLAKQESADGKSFIIGGENKFIDSNFILPSQNEIFNVITGSIKEDESLVNSENQDDYFENLQTNIMGKIDKQYEDTKYVHHYMQDQVRGEKIVNTSLGLLNKVKPGMDTRLNELKSINQANSGELYNFLKVLNFNIENSTIEEKEKLNACISKIGEISNNYKNNEGKDNGFKYPPIIENYLKDETRLNDGNEDPKLGLIFEMFSYYNQHSKDTRSDMESNEGIPSKVIINDLYRDLLEFTSSGQSETATQRENENKEEKDRQDAKNLLESIENMSNNDEA